MTDVVKPRPGLYLVERTSLRGSSEKPCEEAFKITVANVESLYKDTPAKHPIYQDDPQKWYDKGVNHRVENGNAKRDLGVKQEWAVQVEDIQEFICKHGPVVIGLEEDGFCTIEIYDDYRE